MVLMEGMGDMLVLIFLLSMQENLYNTDYHIFGHKDIQLFFLFIGAIVLQAKFVISFSLWSLLYQNAIVILFTY